MKSCQETVFTYNVHGIKKKYKYMYQTATTSLFYSKLKIIIMGVFDADNFVLALIDKEYLAWL